MSSLAAVEGQPNLRPVAVLGAALDLGQGRRGVDMGPSAIRYAGLAARLGELGVRVVGLGNGDAAVAEPGRRRRLRGMRFLPQ